MSPSVSSLNKQDQQTKILPIQRVLNRLTEKIREVPLGNPKFSDPRYIPKDFSPNFFKKIRKIKCDSTLCFIDGGNAPVYASSNIAIHLSRVYFNLFRNGKRINSNFLPQRIEFYTICHAVAERERIFYEAEIVPAIQDWVEYLPDLSSIKFDSLDPTLMTGKVRIPINRIAETSRRFAEWKLVSLVSKYELNETDVVIRDGTLQTSVTNEAIYSSEAMRNAVDHNVILLALAKTSSLFTSTGFPLFAAIGELAEGSANKNDAWYYYPIVEITHPDHRAEMYAVKLHPNSDYVFRMEILKSQVKRMKEIEIEKYICALAESSKDPSFPGYPYGLIDADKFARVSSDEGLSENLLFLLCANNSGVFKRLKRCLKSSDAHELLNRIVG